MPIPSDEDMKRISRAVTYVERLQRSAPVAPTQKQFAAPIVQLIRVTGDPAVSGRYPAIVQDYDADTDTWSDLTDADCYAIDPDGGTLAAGIYLARRWGEYSGLPVFTLSEDPDRLIVLRPTWTGTVTDYQLPAGKRFLILADLSAAATLQSVLPYNPTSADVSGLELTIFNVSETYTLTIEHDYSSVGKLYLGDTSAPDCVLDVSSAGISFVMDWTGNGWVQMDSGLLEVHDSRGAPHIQYSARKIIADYTTGISATPAGDGDRAVTLAGVSAGSAQTGMVNQSAQSFSGRKSFLDGLDIAKYATWVRTDVTWGSDQTDYSIPDATTLLAVTPSSSVSLKSMVDALVSTQTRFVWILHVGSSNTLTIAHQNTSGTTSAYRIITDTAADIALTAGQMCLLWRNANESRWRAFKIASAGSGSVPSATTAGTLLISDGSSWLEKFAITNSEGYIVTNEEGLIVASGV